METIAELTIVESVHQTDGVVMFPQTSQITSEIQSWILQRKWHFPWKSNKFPIHVLMMYSTLIHQVTQTMCISLSSKSKFSRRYACYTPTYFPGGEISHCEMTTRPLSSCALSWRKRGENSPKILHRLMPRGELLECVDCWWHFRF